MKMRLFSTLVSYILFPARNFVINNTMPFLAGVILVAGAFGVRANQTVTLQHGFNFVACQVNGTGGNDINNPSFLSVPSAFSSAITLLVWEDCASSPIVYTYYNSDDSPDGNVGWYDAENARANNVIWNPGRGMAINYSGTPATLTFNGAPLSAPVAKTLSPGCFYLLGSQVSGSETFDNIVGHPATGYTQVEVYRFFPGGTAGVPGIANSGFNLYTSTAGVWSPPFPTLNAGESVFIRVPGFSPLAVFPSHGNVCFSPTLTILGGGFTGFNTGSGDMVKLTGGGLGTPIVGTAINVLNDEQLRANFDLSSASPGMVLDVEVTKGGVTKTISGAFLVTPITISAVVPNQAGNCGSQTLTVVGDGICPGATLKLHDSSDPDIIGTAATVNADGTAITATFNLSGAALGSRDAVIVNPDASTATAAGAFSVATCLPAQIKVTLLGQPVIGVVSSGVARSWTFQLAYKNIGNNDAINVPMTLTGVPAGVTCIPITTSPPATVTADGFSFTAPVVAGSSGYSYFMFTLQAYGSPLSIPLVANSLSPYPDSSTFTVGVVASYDPNGKFGLPGVGANHYMTGSELLPYQIHFENTPSATAPAQQVFVTDQLDTTKLDVSTFSLGPITFGTQTINPPPGLQNFTTEALFDVDGNPATGADDIIVRIVANLETDPLNPNYGRFTCNYLSIDPLTGLLPVDPTRGFLPPNVTQPDGEGSVLFTIQPKPGLADGAVIANGATIVFDVNAPILTPVWENTIDQSKPVSAVAPLPAVSPSTAFDVTWSGTDVGSGIASYDLWVSDNGGGVALWLAGATATTDVYPGVNGHTYQFYSIARDALGNVEDAPATPDATTTVNTSTLKIEWDGNQVRVTWSGGVLEESDSLSGVWPDAAVQVSPWTFAPTEEKKFFRVRVQ